MKERKLFLHCPSVGSFVDTSNLMVYPELANGKPEYNNNNNELVGVDFMDLSSEWWEKLSEQDFYNVDVVDFYGMNGSLEEDEKEYIEDGGVPAKFLIWESV